MAGLVTIFGGSGFVGRYITRRLAQQGWRIRVACRRPNEALFVRPYGVVGQVEPVFCNIRDDRLVRDVTRGADVVVNCVGTFDAFGKNNFDAIQVDGATRIARMAAECGVTRMVHVSAIGADADGASAYARSKAEGERGVTEHMPRAVILRPSVVFGPEDAFFNRFAGMARSGPVVPIVGGSARFQPVYVDDVAAAAALAVNGKAEPGVYELGGPDVRTFRELIDEMMQVIRRRALVVDLPRPVALLMGKVFDVGDKLIGLKGPISADQVRQLGTDNVVAPDARGFEALGLSPIATEAVLPDYLWRFRPSGQYAAITDSARNLRS